MSTCNKYKKKKENKIWYHLTDKYLGKEVVLKPNNPKANISDEGNIPRLCVSDSILCCLRAVIGSDDLDILDIVDEYIAFSKNENELFSDIDKIEKEFSNLLVRPICSFDGFSSVSEEINEKGTASLFVEYNKYKALIDNHKKFISEVNSKLLPNASSVTYFNENEEEITYFRFFNPSIYKVIGTPFIPPNAIDFRLNHEHWFLEERKAEFVGYLDFSCLFENHKVCLTNNKFSYSNSAILNKFVFTNKMFNKN